MKAKILFLLASTALIQGGETPSFAQTPPTSIFSISRNEIDFRERDIGTSSPTPDKPLIVVNGRDSEISITVSIEPGDSRDFNGRALVCST